MTFKPTSAQNGTLAVLLALIGSTGVHRAEPQGDDMILDLLPGEHVVGPFGGPDPFCVRVAPMAP